jgi:transposase-like protein
MDGMLEKQTRKAIEWRQRLARYAASGQEVKSFCQAEAVSEAAFYRWRKQLAEAGGTAPNSGFIDVGVMSPAPAVSAMTQCESAGATLEVRLDLGHGLVLQIVRR